MSGPLPTMFIQTAGKGWDGASEADPGLSRFFPVARPRSENRFQLLCPSRVELNRPVSSPVKLTPVEGSRCRRSQTSSALEAEIVCPDAGADVPSVRPGGGSSTVSRFRNLTRVPGLRLAAHAARKSTRRNSNLERI
jgi:hypothetical protein